MLFCCLLLATLLFTKALVKRLRWTETMALFTSNTASSSLNTHPLLLHNLSPSLRFHLIMQLLLCLQHIICNMWSHSIFLFYDFLICIKLLAVEFVTLPFCSIFCTCFKWCNLTPPNILTVEKSLTFSYKKCICNTNLCGITAVVNSRRFKWAS